VSLAPLATLLLAAVAPIRYRVEPDFQAGTFHVVATIPHAEPGDLEFWMPRWTAGAYHLAEYGRFVTSFAAHDDDGDELIVDRTTSNRFLVTAGAADVVTLEWTARVCAPRDTNDGMILDVEGNRLTADYGYFSPNSLLGFVKGEQDRPCEVEVALPDGWAMNCALAREGAVLSAPSWWRLEDSPVFFSPSLHTIPFEVGGVPHDVSVYGRDEAAARELADHCRRIVEAASGWMQGLPYQRYVFLLGFVPEASGGTGLEHSDSTLILLGRGPEIAPEIDHVIAHEYFHCWCAERIHVAALEHPDYTKPLSTGTIWANEGITEYFSHHLLVRAGLETRVQFFDALWTSAAQARAMWGYSGDGSWTDVDRAASRWDGMEDLIAFSLKNYQGGCWTVLGLDLAMRRESDGERGVADLLRFLYRAYASRGRGYGEDELLPIAEGIAQGRLADYFGRYIDGPELPDLKELLGVIGYTTKGGLKKVVPLEDPSPEQKAALEDFFTPPPARE
jgi:predicted metalloprotease with PDZ domain